MASLLQRSRWSRIYLQTTTLIYKNLLIFYKSWISTGLRAFLFPVIVAIVFSELYHLGALPSYSYEVNNNWGISKISYPIRDLADAINTAPSKRIVFVRNGISNDTLGPVIEGVFGLSGMEAFETYSVDDADDLFDLCKQSLAGYSDCFAAVIFQAFNETNADYVIALDYYLTSVGNEGDYRNDDSYLSQRVLPLQWAIESQIGGFSTAPKPSVVPFAGYFGPNAPSFSSAPSDDEATPSTTKTAKGLYWLTLVTSYVAPVFILILIGVVYHLATFVATERETGMAELMEAQNVTPAPRILSTLLSFFALYFPGLLASSIIITQVLFVETSDILFLWMTLLASASIISCSHFVASLFGKAQLAGLTASTLVFALALVTLAPTLTNSNTQATTYALGLIFPPCTWAYLVGDVANREAHVKAFSLAPEPLPPADPFSMDVVPLQLMNGYLYVVFFIVQIVCYTVAAYVIEKKVWGITRNFNKIAADSDVALRCTSLTKTYYGRRPWYWPFMRKGDPVIAINNLNLEVKKGSVTFLLGPNGGGKTTTLKCVAGMTKMDDISVLEINEAGLVFGICPQMNVNWETLTVQEHVKIWRKLKTAAFQDLEADDDDVIVECDLLEKIHASAKTLSGGQARKLQLAMAFVGGSKVCCIDEASSGLDPLSRRNIWNIIQRGHDRRTILITTHFLDEADVLADHITIVYKGKLVCEGPGTALKARYGDDYVIRSDADGKGTMVWSTTSSTEATKKLLELESLGEDRTYNVVFPTLEQVFLKVTSDTAIDRAGGDGVVGDDDNISTAEEKTFELENDGGRDLNLESGHSIGLARQVEALFMKRYILLLQVSGWLSYGISLVIPIIIAAAVVKFLHRRAPMQTCADNARILRTPTVDGVDASGYPYLAPLTGYEPPASLYMPWSSIPTVYIGPESAFSGEVQDELYVASLAYLFQDQYDPVSNSTMNSTWQNAEALSSRAIVNSTADMITSISNSSGLGFNSFGLFSPSPDTNILYFSDYRSLYGMGDPVVGINLLTNRISNSTAISGTARIVTTSLRTLQVARNKVPGAALPLAILIVLGFIAATSIAIIYPAYEKNNRVRALHYCNGVEPFALWLGYLLFDIQIIVIQSIVVWAVLFAGSLTKIWYEPSYLLGSFILFGIATYLGTYVLSLFTKKAAFAIAAGVHALLFVFYLAAYLIVNSVGNGNNKHEILSAVQYGLGLICPAANLSRALWVSGNVWEILCGKYGVADTTSPFAYVRYGSVYANLIIQIIFCSILLITCEYGSLDWIRRHTTQRRLPARLHYIIENSAAPAPAASVIPTETEKQANAISTSSPDREILKVDKISKIFGRDIVVQNISFDIHSNRIMALLGGNGAGKTTIINMIRGELTPSFGTISLDGIDVQQNLRKARLGMGVCPQDDAVDNLTVSQTLKFYATVKGLRNAEANVAKVMEALNITIYKDIRVKELSGGTKRKLSVAIALLGNPRILLLDEPSTGQDAGAKRVLWKTLKGLERERAVLLTTHSMEEAEALATDVTIIGGRMLAKGTLGSLQEEYGAGFTVKAVRADGVSKEELERRVLKAFAGAREYVDRAGLVQWELGLGRGKLGGYMRECERLTGVDVEERDEGGEQGLGGSGREEKRAVLSHYTITGPTLEEVFMNVAKQAETTSEA